MKVDNSRKSITAIVLVDEEGNVINDFDKIGNLQVKAIAIEPSNE